MHRPRGYGAQTRERARETIDRVVNSIVRRYDPDKVIVFGSYARGDIHEGSDLDLLIIKETSARFTDRIGTVMRACDFDTAIEPLVYTPAELDRMVERGNDFILTALQEGKVVYQKQRERT
ncbi:MAG: nucleotidyltransferase domain-containing protein [Chloroflexi bacterium]|nr:nucleotidyltransferase domain-containing protein [Chloroflexota bacterium]